MFALVVVLKKGQSLLFGVTYINDNGLPYDLTGYDIKITAKANSENGETLFDLSVGSGITINNLVLGNFTVSVQDTSLFEAGRYVWDIVYVAPSGYVDISTTNILEIKTAVTNYV